MWLISLGKETKSNVATIKKYMGNLVENNKDVARVPPDQLPWVDQPNRHISQLSNCLRHFMQLMLKNPKLKKKKTIIPFSPGKSFLPSLGLQSLQYGFPESHRHNQPWLDDW